MPSTQEITRANNDAVRHLYEGEFGQSLYSATKALERMQATLRANDQGGDQEAIIKPPACKMIRSIPLPKLSDALAKVDSGAVDLFQCGLWFDCGQENKQQDILLAAVLLYNTGLCHHMLALRQQAGSSKMLERALTMYTMASHLLTLSLIHI